MRIKPFEVVGLTKQRGDWIFEAFEVILSQELSTQEVRPGRNSAKISKIQVRLLVEDMLMHKVGIRNLSLVVNYMMGREDP